jgi:hypothetical protein
VTFEELELLASGRDGQAIIEGMLKPGLVLLVGGPKAGKTRLVIDLMGSVATGGRFLGEYEARQGGVVYYMLEPAPEDVVETVKLYGLPTPLDVEFVLPDNTDWTFERFKADLERRVLARPDVRLAVVDMMDRIALPTGVGIRPNENGYEHGRKIYSPYQDLARRLNIALVVIVHSGTHIPKPIGGNAVTGSADTIWTLERETTAVNGKLLIVGRRVREQNLPLAWDPSIGRWSRPGSCDPFVVDLRDQLLKDLIATATDDVVGAGWIAKPQIIEAVRARLDEQCVGVSDAYLKREVERHIKRQLDAKLFQRKSSRPVEYRRAVRAAAGRHHDVEVR